MDAGSKRRQEAAALKKQASAAVWRVKEQFDEGSGVVGLVVVGIIAAGVIGAQSSKPQADPSNALPTGVLSDTYGWPVKAIDDTKSTLVVYEDPQCPYCKMFEQAYSSTLKELSDNGTVNVVFQMASFLDDKLPQSNQASRRAIGALGCAIDKGVGFEYHRLIYANQPADEGTGWSDDQLLAIGSAAGLTEAQYPSFADCVSAGTYLGWADNAQKHFDDEQIPGTPYIALDGKELPDSALASISAFVDYINQNKK